MDKSEGLQVNRRTVLAGAAAVTVMPALAGCSRPTWQTLDPDTGEQMITFWFRRAEDQVELRFTFWNASFASVFHRPVSLKRVDPTRPLLARVEFPAQHVLEEAFLEAQAGGERPVEPPVGAVLSGGSRLVFEIPNLTHGRFPLTEPSLLDWRAWIPQLVPAVRPEASIVAPLPRQTAIELPTRLVLSPGREDHWLGASRPGEQAGRTELWHARLMPGGSGRPTLRAVWTPDLVSGAVAPCFRASLNASDRRKLVLVTHAAERRPEPIEPRLALLTSLGGWLDLDKSWSDINEHFDLLKSWRNRTTQGRDQFVQVEYPALLFPSGFFVSVIKTTERKLGNSPSGKPTAYLRQRFTIKYNELVRPYDAWDMPFVQLEPKDIETPILDEPADFFDAGDFTNGAFWPKIAGVPYELPYIATDHDGRRIEFTLPQICIAALVEPRATQVRNAARAEYAAPANEALRTRAFAAQSVAVSPTPKPGRTSVSVDSIEFGDRPGERDERPMRRFEPIAVRLNASLSAASANRAIQAGAFAWFAPYDLAAAGNTNEVFLVAAPSAPRLDLGFAGNTNDAGGFLAPAFSVAGVSRVNGAFGGTQARAAGTDPFTQGQFNPQDFFPRGAKILGGISISNILEGVAGLAGEKVPSMVSELLEYSESDPVISHSFSWETDKLKSAPRVGAIDPVFLVSGDGPADFDLPTHLSARGEISVPLLNPTAAAARFDASLDNFWIQLALSGQGVVLKIRTVQFATSAGAKGTFKIEILDYQLIGSILSFVQKLQEYLGLFDEDSPVDLTPKGVTIALPSFDIPPIIIGAFNIENIRIRSGVHLPFDGSPIELFFYVSSRNDPFAVTVGLLGGAGHFGLVLDTHGIKLLEASISFGAFKQIEVGGVLRGQAFVLGGLSYLSKRTPVAGNPDAFETKIDYVAFVHAGGSGTVLGFLTVAIDYHVSLTISAGGASGSSSMFGQVSVKYSYKIGFFEKSVSVTFRKQFQGSENSESSLAAARSGLPTMTPAQWAAYKAAFAPEAFAGTA